MNVRLMVRLIDIALNILLGFIAISRLKTEYVELPSAGTVQMQSHVPHEAFLHIHSDLFRFEDLGKRWNCRTISELENLLVNQKDRYSRQGIKLIVTIEPHKASIMQTLVDVIDVCQRNQIEKNLNYENYN